MPSVDFRLSYKTLTDSTDVPFGKVTAIIVAAGGSARMNVPSGNHKVMHESKQLLTICGIPVVIRSLLAYQNHKDISNIILVSRAEDIKEIQSLIRQYEITKLTDIVEGGKERFDSVQKGVGQCADAELIIIHDGARPLVTRDIIDRVLVAAHSTSAAACAVKVKDTIKIADESGKILKTPGRDAMWAVQTPQVFKFALYLDAVANAQCTAGITDDCSVLERAGYPVFLVEGSYENIKITTPEDIVLAEAICKSRESRGMI